MPASTLSIAPKPFCTFREDRRRRLRAEKGFSTEASQDERVTRGRGEAAAPLPALSPASVSFCRQSGFAAGESP